MKKNPFEEEIKEVGVHEIRVNPFQPRREFALEDLEELAQSIKSVGLIHPPVVRRLSHSGEYELLAGERRLRASQLAGLTRIQVHVRDCDASLSAEAALIENIQRVDLNPIEIARALKQLSEQFGYHQDELSKRVGKKRSTVANYLRLLTLPLSIQKNVTDGQISMGHAKAILSLEDEQKQFLLLEKIVREKLTVRETEEAALQIEKKDKRKKLPYVDRDFFLEQLAEKIQHRLGTKVSIMGNGKKGKLMIDYYGLDDLDRLLEVFGVEQ